MELDVNWNDVKLYILNGSQMRKSGFWDISETRWFYYKSDDSLNLILFFIIFKNKKSFKIKFLDGETRACYSFDDLNKSPWNNKKDKKELNDFLNGVYQDFLKNGLVKGGIYGVKNN